MTPRHRCIGPFAGPGRTEPQPCLRQDSTLGHPSTQTSLKPGSVERPRRGGGQFRKDGAAHARSR
jgi:hypothetical protein